MTNEKNFIGLEDNFEVESRMIEFGVKPTMTFEDLSDAEKAEFFTEFYDRGNYNLDFTIEDALEMCR